MQKPKLYWEYYKSTLFFNLSSSVLLTIVLLEAAKSLSIAHLSFQILYLLCVMSCGTFISLFYKELSRKGEYYFYYNQGISKLKLWIATITTNIVGGVFLIYILYYVKLA